jgi:hypothetical protein
MVRIRMGVRTKAIKDSSLAGKQKKYIAQIHTLMKELEIEEMARKADNI